MVHWAKLKILFTASNHLEILPMKRWHWILWCLGEDHSNHRLVYIATHQRCQWWVFLFEWTFVKVQLDTEGNKNAGCLDMIWTPKQSASTCSFCVAWTVRSVSCLENKTQDEHRRVFLCPLKHIWTFRWQPSVRVFLYPVLLSLCERGKKWMHFNALYMILFLGTTEILIFNEISALPRQSGVFKDSTLYS